MAVDPKYVEEVKDTPTLEDFEELFEELGIEAEYEKNTSVDIPAGYNIVNIKDSYDGEYYEGRPAIGEIQTTTFEKDGEFDDDGNPVVETIYRIEFALIDDEEEEAFLIPINLKSNEIVQKNVYEASKLFRLVKGIADMRMKGSMDRYNKLPVVNLEKITEALNKIPSMTIKIVEENFGNTYYNSFYVVNGEDE